MTAGHLPDDVMACPNGAFAQVAWCKLRRWALYMAARFNAPVLLVGSALYKSHPRDIDVRIIISDVQFNARYGVDSHGWTMDGPPQKWVDDMGNLCEKEATLAGLNLDFQVYPANHARQYDGKPCVVLAAPSVFRLEGEHQ
jgi:hypothetical protein